MIFRSISLNRKLFNGVLKTMKGWCMGWLAISIRTRN